MSKISKYDPYPSLPIPEDAAFVFAYRGKDYQVPLSNIISSGNYTTDYRYNILEIPDGINKIFTLRFDYILGSCRVYLNGLRQTLNNGDVLYHYKEIGNKQIEFNNPPPADPDLESGDLTLIVVDYIANITGEDGIFDDEFDDIFE